MDSIPLDRQSVRRLSKLLGIALTVLLILTVITIPIAAQTDFFKIDSFEGDDFADPWTVDGASISTATASEGDQSALFPASANSLVTIESDQGDGLPYYPERGDTFRFDVYYGGTDSEPDFRSVDWAYGDNQSYRIVSVNDDATQNLRLIKNTDSGSVILAEESGVTWPTQEWITWEVEYDTSGNGYINATAYAQDGSVIADISAQDTEYNTGGIRVRADQRFDSPDFYVDYFRTTEEVESVQESQQTETENELAINARPYMHHGTNQSYTVTFENESGRFNVSQNVTVQSSDTSVVTVYNTNLTLVSTSNTSVNDRIQLTTSYTSGGRTYEAEKNITVANKTVENIAILPTGARVSASFQDTTIQVIIVATMIGAGVAFLSRAFAGLAAQTLIMVLGWLGGMVGNGMVIVSFMIALFIGLNVATNIDYEVAAR